MSYLLRDSFFYFPENPPHSFFNPFCVLHPVQIGIIVFDKRRLSILNLNSPLIWYFSIESCQIRVNRAYSLIIPACNKLKLFATKHPTTCQYWGNLLSHCKEREQLFAYQTHLSRHAGFLIFLSEYQQTLNIQHSITRRSLKLNS